MKTKIAAISSIIFLGSLIAAIHSNPSMAANLQAANPDHSSQSTAAAGFSCADPLPGHEAACQEMEAEILKSTARLLIYSPLMYVEGFGMRIISSMGHGTVKDGRYLVTHNHFDETVFSILKTGDPENLLTVEILDAGGEYLDQVTGRQVSVQFAENETVVFDFGTRDGRGLFDALGFASADFLAQSELDLAPGTEVAQIDWDGSSAHVDWVPVVSIHSKADTPIVQVTNCIKKGASGGGTFWNGAHIGNNWNRLPHCDSGVDTGVAPYTSVALNPDFVAP